MSDPRTVKTNVHGYKRKPSKLREVQGLLTASGGIHGPDSHNRSGRVPSHRDLRNSVAHGMETKLTRGRSRPHTERQTTTTTRCLRNPRTEAQTNTMRRQTSQGTRGSSGSFSYRGTNDNESAVAESLLFVESQRSACRARTLSPLRKLNGAPRGRTLSPVRKKLANTKPASYIKKVSDELTHRHVKDVLHATLSKRNSKVYTHEAEITSDHSKRYDVPFNPNGFCIFHVDVQLAKRDKKGVWRVIQDACPQCCDTSKPSRSRSSSLNRKSGKAISAAKQRKDAEKRRNSGTLEEVTSETALVVVNPRKGKSRDAKAAATTNETALVVYSKEGREAKSSRRLRKAASNASLTSATHSPDSVRSGPSPAFSSSYFTGTAAGFPTLPLGSDEFNASHANTIKHSNAMVASSRRRSRSKPRVAELSG